METLWKSPDSLSSFDLGAEFKPLGGSHENQLFHLEAYVTSYGGFQSFGPDLGEWLGAAHFFFDPKQ